MTTKTKQTLPQYSVKLSAESGELFNEWIADYRHREGVHLSKSQAIQKLIFHYNETTDKGATNE